MKDLEDCFEVIPNVLEFDCELGQIQSISNLLLLVGCFFLYQGSLLTHLLCNGSSVSGYTSVCIGISSDYRDRYTCFKTHGDVAMPEAIPRNSLAGLNDYLFDLTISNFSPLYGWANPLSVYMTTRSLY